MACLSRTTILQTGAWLLPGRTTYKPEKNWGHSSIAVFDSQVGDYKEKSWGKGRKRESNKLYHKCFYVCQDWVWAAKLEAYIASLYLLPKFLKLLNYITNIALTSNTYFYPSDWEITFILTAVNLCIFIAPMSCTLIVHFHDLLLMANSNPEVFRPPKK